jgi:serine/threonine-protein kinase
VIDGKYRVERTLGAGGMGRVVLAEHLELERRVAIKLVSDASDAELAERLLREARAASRLKGEHVARVHDVGRLPDGTPFLVMEYLQGRDLAAALADGPVPPTTAAIWVRQACEGIAEAHAAGIVHRDVKPANLFLTQRADGSPCVKVLDFGIARTLDRTHPKLTAEATIVGSPAYMAPEQLAGKPADTRTDVWALGVVLYELLTGRLPYPQPSIAEQYACIMHSSPVPPRVLDGAIPVALSDLVLRCLARAADDRFVDARALGSALEPFCDRDARFGFATEAQTLVLPRPKSLRAPIGIATAAGLAAVALVALLFARGATGGAAAGASGSAPTAPNGELSARTTAPLPSAVALVEPSPPPLASSAKASGGARPAPVARPVLRTAAPPAPTTAAPLPSTDPFAHRTF